MREAVASEPVLAGPTSEIELSRLDPDHANPEPRVELDSGEVDRLQGKERVPWGLI